MAARKPATKAEQKSTTTEPARKKLFTEEERGAMKARAQELKAASDKDGR